LRDIPRLVFGGMASGSGVEMEDSEGRDMGPGKKL
jgi:hypothetical protein